MISKIIDALQAFDYYAESEIIEIAKGKYKMPETIKEGKEKLKRQFKMIRND
tara:strand:- start:11 stop:166 length:156 start_codon:yes stop_codon:yes gene_type:complete